MLIRSLLTMLALPLFLLAPCAAQTPEVTLDSGDAVADHVDWVISLFDGGADDLAVEDVEVRFDSNFLRLVPPEEFTTTIRPLAETLGPLELVEKRATEENEHVAVYRAESGDVVMIGLAVDPVTGLMAGFFVIPTQLAGSDATPAASPAASPIV